jgi:hypothetical protein
MWGFPVLDPEKCKDIPLPIQNEQSLKEYFEVIKGICFKNRFGIV